MLEERDYLQFIELSQRRIRTVQTDTKRYMYDKIDWRDRLISITGSRGTGKTTLLLQHIKEQFSKDPDRVLYASLDHLWFQSHSLQELVDMHVKNGGTHVYLDEVHHLDNWQTLIKNLYDDYPGLYIVYTGSSLLRIDAQGGDLSRRRIPYILPGLSFREYLMFEGIIKLDALSFTQLTKDHAEISRSIPDTVPILGLFNKYLKAGYYPFYKEVYAGYDLRLQQIINQVLESDYPAVEKINYTTVQKIKKMLNILSRSCPQTPKMTDVYRELETDRNQGLKMLYVLDRANLLNLLSAEKATLKNMARPDKIYCDNTNIMYSLVPNVEIGTVRETFFLNQLRSAGYNVTYPPKVIL